MKKFYFLYCVKLNQLQILYGDKNNNFNNVLHGNMGIKKRGCISS